MPNTGGVVLASNPNDAQLFQALKTQASAYLSKEVTLNELGDTIRCAARGEYLINESHYQTKINGTGATAVTRALLAE